ncbi:claudin-23 isoform X2 [Anguilla anguilla]|nr:claudin-23 isoform X2 [Anguilla anguilla]XP_035287883.1 claudin-23 isoform X2 [Anguilla anguilla]
MQTPASMVTGIVCAPLGLVLVFTAAITPQWREGRARLGVARAGGVEATLLRSDGLWESCLQVVESELKQCWPAAGAYQRDGRVRWARGLTLGSLSLCGLGIALASLGVRCWTDFPLRNVAGASGVLIGLSGLLSLAALALYAHNLRALGLGAEPPPAPPPHAYISALLQLSLRPAGSLYFGWVGGCVQVLGGAALVLSFKRPCCSSCARPAASPEDVEAYEINC